MRFLKTLEECYNVEKQFLLLLFNIKVSRHP